MESDKAAIEAVLQGERDRFAELVQRHKRTVYATAWSYLGDADMCEDAAQETFIRAFRYLGSLRDIEHFPAWLAKIARNVSTTLLRRRRNELENRRRWQLEQPSPTKVVDTSDEENLQEMLGSSLAELPPQHRESLVLYYIEGNSIAETAELLGISAAAMKTRLHRARQILRGVLEQQIEQGLDQLTPRKGFVPSVMLLLPAKPLGVVAAGGGVSLIGKVGGWFGSALSGVTFGTWLLLGQLTFFCLPFYFIFRMQYANFVDTPENVIRKSILRRNFLIVATMGFCSIMLGRYSHLYSSNATFFQFFAILFVWVMYTTVRQLRWNRSQYLVGQIIGGFSLLMCFTLTGFFDAHPLLFVVGILILNAFAFSNRHQMPRRLDYSLFLRQANGSLGDTETERPVPRPVTETELRSFVRFLGEQWLVKDFSIRGRCMFLRLPFVQMNVLDSFLGIAVGSSTIELNANGACQPFLSRSDARAILTLTGNSASTQSLEQGVARVVETSLAHFLQGEHAAARRMLSTVEDTAIWVNTDLRTTISKGFLVALAVIFAVFVLILLWIDNIR